MFDDRENTSTPWRVTAEGRRGSTSCTRFCTFTDASSSEVPSLNVTVRLYEPSEPDVELMYIIPSTPFTDSSMGTPTVSATVCASAPGYVALTETVGGVISGYCATGRVLTVMTPTSIISTASTVAKMSRSMKNLENIATLSEN